MPERGKPTPGDYKLIFEDNRVGSLLLEDLTARFARKAVTTGGIDAVLATYKNAGQWEVINFILGRINEANRPREPQTSEVTVE